MKNFKLGLWIFIISFFLGWFALSWVAWAEGDWRSKYRNHLGVPCCGEKDCEIIHRSRIQLDLEGWKVDGDLIPKYYEKISEDDQFWYCPQFGCFFIPGGKV